MITIVCAFVWWHAITYVQTFLMTMHDFQQNDVKGGGGGVLHPSSAPLFWVDNKGMEIAKFRIKSQFRNIIFAQHHIISYLRLADRWVQRNYLWWCGSKILIMQFLVYNCRNLKKLAMHCISYSISLWDKFWEKLVLTFLKSQVLP